MIKTKIWVIIFALILIISSIAAVIIFANNHDCQQVQIVQNGVIIKEIDLSKVDTPYEFKVEDENGGYNSILVENGKIRISSADCPDKVCVHQGWLKNEAPIVCLPHKLVIKAAETNGLDTVSK